MGSVHNELNKGEISKAVKNALGVEGGESGVERFSETLQPVMPLWDLPEWKLLRKEVAFSRWSSTPAVAARLSAFQMTNPKGSGTLAVIEEVQATGADCTFDIEQGFTVVLANPVLTQGVAEDARYGFLGESSILTINSGDAAAGAALPQMLLRSGVRYTGLGFVMMPSSKLFVFSTAVNTSINCHIRWRERAAFVRELGVNP